MSQITGLLDLAIMFSAVFPKDWTLSESRRCGLPISMMIEIDIINFENERKTL